MRRWDMGALSGGVGCEFDDEVSAKGCADPFQQGDGVGLEYAIVAVTCFFSQQPGALDAAIWYSCMSPPRTCLRRIRYSARLISGGRVWGSNTRSRR